jgi:ComF family protein
VIFFSRSAALPVVLDCKGAGILLTAKHVYRMFVLFRNHSARPAVNRLIIVWERVISAAIASSMSGTSPRTQARAVVCYQAPVAEAVRIFKYNGKMHGLETFAALTRQYYLHHPLPEPEFILPVPLHPKRLRKRGFNQALVLCRKLFPKIKERIDSHVLERHQWTLPQTGLNGAERRRNVKNAFRIKNPEKIKNKKILLVDDVFTTGSTVNECARILLKNKAADVEVFTFARATDRQ